AAARPRRRARHGGFSDSPLRLAEVVVAMSLINQVLRDLDQRHASAVAVPAAVRAPARAVGSRRGRNLAWGALAVAALAMGVGAVSLNSASRAVAPAALPAAAAATPLAAAAALREEAGYAPARQALSGLLIAQGRGDEAKALLSDGLALAPREPGLAMMLARLLAEHGELQRAADVLQAAAVNSPSPEDCAFHAAILQRLNRHAEAAVMFAAALRVMPNNGVWWMGLG